MAGRAAFSTTLPLLAQQGLGHTGHHCSGLPKPCATHRHQHPAAPSAISILGRHMWDGHWAAVPAHQRCTQELNQKEPAAWDLLPLSPAHSRSGWGRAQPSAAPGMSLELQAGLHDIAELHEGEQVCPAQPPGLAHPRFIWNEQFPNKLRNLKILRIRKRQKGGETAAAQPVHGDHRATR